MERLENPTSEKIKSLSADDDYHLQMPISSRFKTRILMNIRLSEKPIEAYFIEEKSVPNGMTPAELVHILQSPVSTMQKDYYDFVKRNWWKVKTKAFSLQSDILVPITANSKKRLSKNIKLSREPFENYFINNETLPDGLTKENLLEWIESDCMEIKKTYLEFLMKNWWNIKAKEPSKEMSLPSPDIVVLDSKILEQLMEEFRRTGVGILNVLKLVDNLPKELRPRTVSTWFYPNRKRCPVAKKEHIDFVFNLYRCIPDKKEIITSKK